MASSLTMSSRKPVMRGGTASKCSRKRPDEQATKEQGALLIFYLTFQRKFNLKFNKKKTKKKKKEKKKKKKL